MMTQIGLWKGGEQCCCISESEKVEPVGGGGEEGERGRKESSLLKLCLWRWSLILN